MEREPSLIDVLIVVADDETLRPKEAYRAFIERCELEEINFRHGFLNLGRPVNFMSNTLPDGMDIQFADIWALLVRGKPA